MTNDAPGTDDEPVIGLTYPLPAPRPPVLEDEPGPYGRYAPDDAEDDWEDEDDSDEYAYEDDGYDPEIGAYYAPEAYTSPARQPAFYAFLVIAAIIGAGVVFLVFRAVGSSDDDDAPTATPTAFFLRAEIIDPRNGDRVRANEPVDFTARALSSADLVRIDLLVDDRVVGQSVPQQQQPDQPLTPETAKLWQGTVRTTFTSRGEHKIVMRVVDRDGKTTDAQAIRIAVIEEPADPTVLGRVIATTTLRAGPDDSATSLTTIQPGTEVRVLARNEVGDWLWVQANGREGWLKRSALQEGVNVAALPVREVTPTPTTTPQTQEPGTETPTPTATPENAPDFSPIDARFVFAGGSEVALRLTIANAGASYAGALVVGVTTQPGGLVTQQVVFDVEIPQGGSATVDFPVSGSLPDRADVSVHVDPGNAIRETNEDNNSATFPGVPSPADPPDIQIQSIAVQGNEVVVQVTNSGGGLSASEIRVTVTAGSESTSRVVQTALPPGQSTTIRVARPGGEGEAAVTVQLNGVVVATGSVNLGGGGETPTTTPTETATETATATETPTT